MSVPAYQTALCLSWKAKLLKNFNPHNHHMHQVAFEEAVSLGCGSVRVELRGYTKDIQ